MERFVSVFLDEWLVASKRKPLVLRGARQVGKTWLVRDLANRHSLQLIELNLERFPEYADHFHTNDPQRAVSDLEADLGITIDPKSSLLFLDEIQAAPHLLAFLRWFYEEMPEMPVIAAGSLMEFALRDHDFSMPVGRTSFCHIEPVSFYEFLDASGNGKLRLALTNAAETGELGMRLHKKSLDLFGEYCLVGGLPEVMAEHVSDKGMTACMQLQRNLVATYRDDFNKYRGRISVDLLRRAMDAVPRQLGGRFVYSHVEEDTNHRDIKQAMQLLELARICHRVEHTAANGLPLGAETNPRMFKAILVDIGLVSIQLGLSKLELRDLDRVIWANKGALAEQFVGQHLRCISREFEEPRLFYWQRTSGRQGEIDYIIQHGRHIVPIKVKAGASGSMKSLHGFMHARGFDVAVRFDTNSPSVQELNVKTTTGESVQYRLLSLPIYMVESLPAGLESLLSPS
ncbi:MAG: ATP-binding protein [Spirochaetaceae bacterium]|nr:ATP-binding protein [Spirochaetaceae bacterium]